MPVTSSSTRTRPSRISLATRVTRARRLPYSAHGKPSRRTVPGCPVKTRPNADAGANCATTRNGPSGTIAASRSPSRTAAPVSDPRLRRSVRPRAREGRAARLHIRNASRRLRTWRSPLPVATACRAAAGSSPGGRCRAFSAPDRFAPAPTRRPLTRRAAGRLPIALARHPVRKSGRRRAAAPARRASSSASARAARVSRRTARCWSRAPSALRRSSSMPRSSAAISRSNGGDFGIERGEAGARLLERETFRVGFELDQHVTRPHRRADRQVDAHRAPGHSRIDRMRRSGRLDARGRAGFVQGNP